MDKRIHSVPRRVTARRVLYIVGSIAAVGMASVTAVRVLWERPNDAAVLLGCALVLALVRGDVLLERRRGRD